MVFRNLKKFCVKVTVKSVLQSLFPLQLLNTLCGLSPIEIPNNVVWTKLSILGHIVRSLIFGSLLLYTSDYEYKYNNNRPLIMLVYQVCMYTNLIVATSSIHMHLLHNKV